MTSCWCTSRPACSGLAGPLRHWPNAAPCRRRRTTAGSPSRLWDKICACSCAVTQLTARYQSPGACPHPRVRQCVGRLYTPPLVSTNHGGKALIENGFSWVARHLHLA
ncbi:hypothetical protein RA210_U20070 [Rubrivivax sp. A210]|nr:hypothetical protein RA210_U20070 [Rubrivivax sp. A210]